LHEHGGVQEPSINSDDRQLRFGYDDVETQVPPVTGGVEKAGQFSNCADGKWLGGGQWEYDITEVPEFGSVVVAQEIPVSEHQEALPLGVPTDSDPDRVELLREFRAFIETVTAEDLTTVSKIISEEFSRRSRAEYGYSGPPEILHVHGEVTGSPATASPPGLGDAVDDN
jgi:hypothetical protein